MKQITHFSLVICVIVIYISHDVHDVFYDILMGGGSSSCNYLQLFQKERGLIVMTLWEPSVVQTRKVRDRYENNEELALMFIP